MATQLTSQIEQVDPAFPAEQFDRIRCPDCGHTDPAPEGAALIFGLEAPCPHCGGRRCEFVAENDSLRQVA